MQVCWKPLFGFMSKFQRFCELKKMTIETFLTGVNKGKLYSPIFQIVPLSSVKSQNVVIWISSIPWGKGCYQLTYKQKELAPPPTAEAAKERRELVKQRSVSLSHINSQVDWYFSNLCRDHSNHSFRIKSTIFPKEVLTSLHRSSYKDLTQKLQGYLWLGSASYRYHIAYNSQSKFYEAAIVNLCSLWVKRKWQIWCEYAFLGLTETQDIKISMYNPILIRIPPACTQNMHYL